MKISAAIKNLLMARTVPDLAEMYSSDMEVQINAAQDNGEPVVRTGRARRYTDGVQEWGPIRIPRNAGTIPEDNDGDLKWDIAAHAEGIGMTGWDWRSKVSRFVAFDFDSISNHVRAALTDEQMNEVKTEAQKIPWVTVRKSTSGKGLHLYVMLSEIKDGIWNGGVPTENHHEHAALARSILGLMASKTNFDFSGKVDVCGGNMWAWHRKMAGTDGLTIVKTGGVLSEIPPNWRDHVPVVRGEKKRAAPKFVEAGQVDDFEELTGTHIRIKLDEGHKKLIVWLESQKRLHWWDADRHLLVAHTHDLKEAHDALASKGIFETLAHGKDRGNDQNCFLFPLSNGGWVVRRHTPGVQEHTSWDQDGHGWTRTFFNVEPGLSTAARVAKGAEHPKGGFHFRDADSAAKALEILGISTGLPPMFSGREGAIIKERRDGKIVLEIPRSNLDKTDNMDGWVAEPKKWLRVFSQRARIVEDADNTNLSVGDKVVRHIVDIQNQDSGWVIRNASNEWQHERLDHITYALKTFGLLPAEVTQIVGANVLQSWQLVNEPFQPEYPGNRRWNKNAAQFRFAPSPNSDGLKFDTWLKVLVHAGKDLDYAVRIHPWCVANGIDTGADYLLHWIASIFQFPDKSLPYLFFWSKEQNTGKSTFHEALQLLMTSGYVDGSQAVSSQGGYNGELAGAVVCAIEEKSIQNQKEAYGRIKHWVTARQLPIHPKGGTPYLAKNCTHWVHCANDRDACPIFPGDTRITMIHVRPLDLLDMIPKYELISRLEAEAPDFLRHILDLEIPKPTDRLNIPMIETEEKKILAARNKDSLEAFIEENCWLVPGHVLLYGEFYERFEQHISDPNEAAYWSKPKVTKSLPVTCPTGRLSNTPWKHIGNITWRFNMVGEEIPKPEPIGRALISMSGKLVPGD